MSKPITDTMHHIGNGFFISTASDKFKELIKKVDETNKPGKIDLTISVKKLLKTGAMHVTGKVKATMPADEPMETVLFTTDDGSLSADNPRQQKLELKVVDEQKQEPKTIEATN